MKLSYEDLISGDDIFIPGVCHIRQPLLSDLKPTHGIGILKYNLYLNVLIWDKKELMDFLKAISANKHLDKIETNSKISVFEILILMKNVRELFLHTFQFFIIENIEWNEKQNKFIISDKDGIVGYIDRHNFDEIRDCILQVNYINLGKQAVPKVFENEKARELWNKAQEYLKQETRKNTKDKQMQLGNIISKLSCVGVGYTLLNIYNLTIFQLYDQFFQYGYLRATNLSDRIFCNHGGENFDAYNWLTPIKNNKEK